jgi:hypothetical protein
VTKLGPFRKSSHRVHSKTVILQTIWPVKRVIVSGDSTEITEEIGRTYDSDHQWSKLVRMSKRQQHDFAAKAHAFDVPTTSWICLETSWKGFQPSPRCRETTRYGSCLGPPIR